MNQSPISHRLFVLFFLVLAACWLLATAASAQTITNLQLRCIIALDSGPNTTNTINVSNANILLGYQHAWTNFQAALPQANKMTNYSQFPVELLRQQVVVRDFRLRVVQALAERVDLLTDAEAATLLGIANAH